MSETRTDEPQGLSSAEAARRLREHGPNSVPQEKRRPLRALALKFWAPVPWMLEAAVVLQLALGKLDEAAVIAALLVLNALLAFAQEGRADRALALLRGRLSAHARVLRDGTWQVIPAGELVPGDAIHLRLGDIVPADVRIGSGQMLLDQSALTGESLPVEAAAGAAAYAGSTVRRGEATGEVTATGTRTYFGRTAELVRTAKTVTHLEGLIFTIVRYLVALDVALVVALLAYAIATGLPLTDTLPFALVLLVASVPAALPATFTLAQAFGAQELAHRGVLVTRLSAIEEAAAMDVLATDKTGTITENRLALTALQASAPRTEGELLRLAALASDEATQDPIDLAVLAAARAHGALGEAVERLSFEPFDPATKRSEALVREGSARVRVVKGAPLAVAALIAGTPDLRAATERLAAGGQRVIAVAAGPEGALELAGLLALSDPPRANSAQLIASLRALGVRVIMVTGDGLETARAVAARVGIGARAGTAEALRQGGAAPALECDVYAGVLPEDKFNLVRALQRAGHVVGMTGDGVNDAPALKQAEVGIAVSSATDVAKASASVVLTNPGLAEVVAAVETSRRIYQRMLTYTLNKIVKTLEIAVFLSVGVMLTGVFVVTPLLMVLLLFTNDFVTMTIATDRVSFSPQPDRWRVPELMRTAAALAAVILALSFTVFFAGRDWLHLPLAQLQTLVFVMLVLSGQGTVYVVRERRHFWHSRPSGWLLAASAADVALVALLALEGIFMAPVAPALLAALAGAVLAMLLALDFLKVRIFRRLV
ncbi:MAG TPA: plasma-membrane proton-efflux P-type ATPase [Burkholderiales bacterium]|nr:plasma-membrane proton-efflux P-type ATPase [Burkholderiales bacterium]